jgi:hypothetical protein
VRRRHGLSDRAVVGVEGERGEELSPGSFPCRFGGRQPILRRLVVGTRVVGALERVLEADVLQRRVRELVGQREGLADGQADRVGELQLRLLEVVPRDDGPLTGVLHLDLRAHDVHPRD